MRGEHTWLACFGSYNAGSSPHARGAHLANDFLRSICRIIPACAGSTKLKMHFVVLAWDHPRMRGEH